MADCFFHTGRPSVTRCKQCSKPLCAECRHITENGIFCSDECARSGEVFKERVENMDNRVLHRKGIPWIVKLVIAAVVIYGLYRLLATHCFR